MTNYKNGGGGTMTETARPAWRVNEYTSELASGIIKIDSSDFKCFTEDVKFACCVLGVLEGYFYEDGRLGDDVPSLLPAIKDAFARLHTLREDFRSLKCGIYYP